jgi:hypothetical protein
MPSGKPPVQSTGTATAFLIREVSGRFCPSISSGFRPAASQACLNAAPVRWPWKKRKLRSVWLPLDASCSYVPGEHVDRQVGARRIARVRKTNCRTDT